YPLLLTKAIGEIYEQCSGVRELGIMHFYQKFKPKLPPALSGFLRLAIEWSIREELSYWPHDDFVGASSCADESHIQAHYVIKRDCVSYIVPLEQLTVAERRWLAGKMRRDAEWMRHNAALLNDPGKAIRDWPRKGSRLLQVETTRRKSATILNFVR